MKLSKKNKQLIFNAISAGTMKSIRDWKPNYGTDTDNPDHWSYEDKLVQDRTFITEQYITEKVNIVLNGGGLDS